MKLSSTKKLLKKNNSNHNQANVFPIPSDQSQTQRQENRDVDFLVNGMMDPVNIFVKKGFLKEGMS